MLAEGCDGPEDDPMDTACSAGVRCMTPLVLRLATLEASDGCIKVPPAHCCWLDTDCKPIYCRHIQASLWPASPYEAIMRHHSTGCRPGVWYETP